MATTYDFLTLIATGNATQAFQPTYFLTFSEGIKASDLTINTSGANITIQRATGFVLTLSGFSQDKIASANFIFADGGKIVFGDGLGTTSADTGDNKLIGTDFGDYLDGGIGVDTASYATATSAVTVDLDISSAQNTIGAGMDKLLNIENVTGSVYSDTLYGNSGTNVLDGGANIDIMNGREGADTYYATAGDIITDDGSTGTDVVYAAVDYALGAGIERLILTGNSAISGRGNSLNNTLTGNSGNNVLDGGTGDDVLDAGAGLDTYFVDSANDSITEIVTGGTDWVASTAASFDMGSQAVFVENMRLLSGATTGTGNDLANTILGNSNNNFLNGGAGNDILSDLFGGDDTLTGGDGIDTLTGGTGNDTLIGGISITASDSKADTMTGGSGNDTYYVTDSLDVVVEAANATYINDWVYATISYALNNVKSVGVEKLTLTGSNNINGSGNSLANTITGNSGDNSLTGSLDILAGDTKTDTLIGGLGNDTYNVTDIFDVIVEAAGEGTDIVNSIVDFALNDTVGGSVGVENLTLKGTGNITGTGNSLANTITGNSGNNTLNGGAGTASDTLTDTLGGNDILNGGAGGDTMKGGIGNDTYIVDDALDNITEDALGGTDVVQASLNYSIASDVDIENLTLTGTGNIDGTGNSSANTIIGTSGNNKLIGGDNADYLQGGAGDDSLIGGSRDTGTIIPSDGTPDADTMDGGTGNDTYWVDFETDAIIESLGTTNGSDLVMSRVSYTLADVDVENLTLTGTTGLVTNTNNLNGTGNSSANTLTGNAGNNTLSGLAGIDSLVGNAGNDILDGGVGADVMTGGIGKDTYIVETTNSAANNGDQITETGADIDLVQAYATYTIFNINVENLILMGTTNINGTGNTSANVLTGNTGSNILIGDAGNDTLDGKEGADTLKGGAGQDSYYIDNASDSIDETGGDATAATTANATLDTVFASVNFSIASDVKLENLTLIGTNIITGTGNSSANILTGNAGSNALDAGSGADIIDGGAGKDAITGGAGTDTYVFSAASDSSLVNFDVITDFKASGAAEKINLSAIDSGTLLFGNSRTATPTNVSAAHTIDYYVSSSNTFLIVDTDGDSSTIDFKLQLTGFTGLTTDDIIK